MPMDFPDMNSLKRTAEIFKFRQPNDKEIEEEYRKALANHVLPLDRIESFEILFRVGWDKWDDAQKKQALGM